MKKQDSQANIKDKPNKRRARTELMIRHDKAFFELGMTILALNYALRGIQVPPTAPIGVPERPLGT